MINTEQRTDSLSNREVGRTLASETYTKLAQASQELDAILAHGSEDDRAKIEAVIATMWEKVTARRRSEAFEYGID